MSLFFSILEATLYYLCIYCILNTSEKHSRGYKTVAYLNVLFRIGIMSAVLILKPSFYVMPIIIVIIDSLFLNLTFKGCKFKKIISLYAILYSINLILSSVVFLFVEKHVGASGIRTIGGCTGFLIVGFCLITVKTKSEIFSYLQIIPSKVKRICIISIVSSAIAISGVFFGVSMKDVVNWNLYVKILVIACIAVVGSVFPVLITTSVGKEFYNKQSKMFENQIKIQAKHYEELANNSLEIRRFKHDYNNMLIGVQLLLKNGDILGATEMLNSGRGIIFGGAESEFDTGNSIVDAILTEKQAKAAESNSVICFEGAVPARCIDPSDLCVIFCNTIDNAIEACEKIKAESKNEIKIVCRSVSGFTFMNISNPTKDNIKAYNNMIKTTKADKHEHGLGLYSLRKAIDNYDGEMTLMCDNNIFTVDIELDLTSRIA